MFLSSLSNDGTGSREIVNGSFESLALDYINSRRNEAPKSTLRRITSLRAFAMWAWSLEILSDYIAPTPAHTLPHPLREGMADLFKLINDPSVTSILRRLLILQGLFGLRVSEARAVQLGHFDIVNLELTVRGKGDKVRHVAFSLETYQRLIEGISTGADMDLLLIPFSDSRARALITSVGYRILGYHISSHDLRATCLTELYERTQDIRLVADFAGHSDINQTMRYIKTNRAAMLKAVHFGI